MRNDQKLNLEKKARLLLENYSLIRRTRSEYTIAATEDLTLLALTDGLSEEVRNRYLHEIVPYYKELSPEPI